MTVDTVKALVDQVLGYHIGIMTVCAARLIHISSVQARMVCRTMAIKTGYGKAVLAVVDHIGIGRVVMTVATGDLVPITSMDTSNMLGYHVVHMTL